MKNNDNIAIFPSRCSWGEIYRMYRDKIVSGLSAWYCLADREDAVEYAFDKLMNKKDPESYGENMPASAEEWSKVVYWHARSYLSHMKEHSRVHAKYIEKMSGELEDAFVPGDQGMILDRVVYSRAMATALESFRNDQDVSRRDLEIYVAVVMNMTPAKILAQKFNITENNVGVIKCRVGKLLSKLGKSYFRAALGEVA